VRYENITSRLLDSAEHVVVSYPRLNGDQALRLSALYKGSGELVWERDQAGLASLLGRGTPPPELFTDDQGPVLQNTAIRGGATMFKDQSACPFRAFARHRLAASGMPGVEAGLDATERGQLVHDCIARLWHELKSSAALAALSDQNVQAVVEQSIAAAVAGLSRRDSSRFRQSILNMERVRLPGLLTEWLLVEREREPFDVAWVEHKINAKFAGLDLSLRIDRIDVLEGGKYAIIDYKTGLSVSVGDWMGERPAEPQLPLYLLGIEGEVGALAYAHLRTGCGAFRGLAGDDAFSPGIEIEQDWSAMREQWRRVLTDLAEQYKAGFARVDPSDDKVCRFCDVKPFCRVTDRPLTPTLSQRERELTRQH
jgi:ATP-dependent helicase/nuclease subunit B